MIRLLSHNTGRERPRSSAHAALYAPNPFRSAGAPARRRRLLAVLVVAALALAACGGDDDAEDAVSPDAADTTTGDDTAGDDTTGDTAEEAADEPAELTEVSVRLNIPSWGAYHSGIAIAATEGWYTDAGLDVSFGTGTGSTPTAQQVAEGTDDIAFTSADAVSRVSSLGGELKMFANILPDAGNCLMVKADSGITSPEDMAGHSVGDAAGFITLQVLPAFWNATGVDPDSVSVITVDIASRVQAWLAGQYDGLSSFVFGEPVQASMRFDQPNECFLFSDYGVELVGFGFVTTDSYLEENPDVVAAFAEATLRGYEAAFEDPAAGVAAVYEMSDDVPNLAPEEEMTAAIEALEPLAMIDADLGEPYGYNSPERWATMVETMATFAELDPETDPTTLYTNEFLPS